MRIETALQASSFCDELRRSLRQAGPNRDLEKMMRNIEHGVSELSKKEVECRRTHKFHTVQADIENLNVAFTDMEHYILLANLTK